MSDTKETKSWRRILAKIRRIDCQFSINSNFQKHENSLNGQVFSFQERRMLRCGMSLLKQASLKPQDLVVALKVLVNNERSLTLQALADELGFALSVVHGCVSRCELARLISRSSGSIRASRSSVLEFTLHGARYAYPSLVGSLTRGMPTGVAGPVLRNEFEHGTAVSPVWPDPDGTEYGVSIVPLHPAVPAACKNDAGLYAVLSLLDAVRAGAAREQELATQALREHLS